MTEVHRRYRALLEVSNVLNSQREMDSLWEACTERIKEVVPVWKKEHWADGSAWVEGHAVESPEGAGAP